MHNLQPGQMLGPYRLLHQVGQGGMAAVYQAYHAAMDRYVAIKVLPPQMADNPEFLSRFQQEARTIARLEHPHILPVHDYGEAAGLTYLVMRYMEAGTLKDRMLAGPLETDEIDRLFTQLAEALSYAHAHGVVHRDLKPANVMVDAQGNLFLTDFGIAKLLEEDAHLTATGAMLGTPAYMSPEQVLGQKVDQRSDIYSLGVILYQMVTGREPFEADTPMAVALKHVNAPLPLPAAFNPQVSPAVERVILKALAKEPDDRFATTPEFLAAWKRALAEPALDRAEPPSRTEPPAEPAPAPRQPQPAAAPSRQPFWIWAVLAVGVVGLCAGAMAGGLWLASRFTSPPAATQPAAPSSPTPGTAATQPHAAPTEAPAGRATADNGGAALPPALPTAPAVTPSATPPAALNVTNNPGQSTDPRLVFDGRGVLHLTWYDASLRPAGDSQAFELLHRQLSPAGQWSEAASLTAQFELLYQSTLTLLAGPQGQACVTWEGAPAINRPEGIGWYQSCQAEGAWAEAERLTTAETATNDLTPVLMADGIQHSVYVSFGRVFFDGVPLSEAARTAYTPQAAVDAHGGLHVVWIYMDVAELDYAYSSDGGRTWSAAEPLSGEADAPTPSSYRNLALRASPAGGVHLVWLSTAGLSYRGWSAAGWEAPAILSIERGGNPYLAIAPDGRPHIVWRSLGYGGGIQYLYQLADGAWSAPQLITDSPSADMPVLACDAHGRRHLVWAANANTASQADLYYASLP